MNDETRGLRLLCPQGCGDMLTVPVPTLADVNDVSGKASLADMDTLVGRSVVAAILVHCVYVCTAVPASHSMMHVAGTPFTDLTSTKSAPSDLQRLMTSRRSK
jgi:hypothetical protein